ncbi:MAG: hypothetical protein A3F09_03080 [Chlamydiae bacterium RIFCSPHIGHO2_12_FULL_49_11]|nr:MAG: hypothetical protein A3F09_03080 [Chlamydiae bacterium RIFCSPHIGHO2_12_FULL_49_11]
MEKLLPLLVYFTAHLMWGRVCDEWHLSLIFGLFPLLALQFSLSVSLWIAFSLGFFRDVASQSTFFGMHALLYMLTFLAARRMQKYFDKEKILSLSLFATLCGMIGNTLFMIFYPFSDPNLKFTWKTVCTDIMIYPLLDAAAATLTFFLPLFLIKKYQRPLLKLVRR